MPVAIADSLMQQFSHILCRRMGLHFPRESWPEMLRGLVRAARELGDPDAQACMRRLLAAPLQRSQLEILASHLTVGETYFWREPAVFTALECEVLPALIAARRASGKRHLRIWSAGCCTGEEPYSVAVLLRRLIPDIDQWNITLLATDINPRFLAKAVRGEYRKWSFRGTPPSFLGDYFARSGAGNHVLAPHIRRLASFAYLNLVDDEYPALDNNTNAIDIVLCRNVLMYFEADIMRTVLEKLRHALSEGGWLIVSAAEVNSTTFAGFVPVAFADAILYRKGEQAPCPQPDTSLPPAWEPIAAPAASQASGVERQGADLCHPSGAPVSKKPQPVVPDADEPYRRALASYARGDYEAAVKALAETAPSNAQGLALAARACANQGRFDEARRWCEAAVAADKVNPGLRYLLASVLAEQGCDEASEAALKQALYLDQDFVLAHFALGNLYRRRDQSGPAVRHLTAARELLAGHPPGQVLPDAEGLTAGRLLDIIDHGERIA